MRLGAVVALLLLCGVAGAGGDRLIDLEGSEAELVRRFDEGKGRVRFLAVVSPG